MRFTYQLQFAIAFARFCQDNNCEPADLAKAIQHADASARAYARGHFKANEKHMDMFEDIACNKLNCSDVSWPGLYPMFKDKAGHERMLPS